MFKKTVQWVNKYIYISEELLILFAVVFVGSLFAWHVYALELTTIFVDQNSHLNISRMVTDSLTPGISQFGFWPPFIHILLAPFSMITPLFESGLAGAFVLIPALGVGAIFLYQLLLLLTGKKVIGVIGALLLMANPYILYYAVTPMTEVLSISLLLGVAYFTANWLSTQKLSSLIYLGLLITLASLTRFEGFILFPLVGSIVLAKLLIQRKRYYEIEALLLLFSLVAGLGIAFVFIYGLIFGGNPLTFMVGAWSAYEQQHDYLLPAEHNFRLSLVYLLYAAYYMVGKVQVWLAATALVFLLLLIRKRETYLSVVSVTLVLISPLIFNAFAITQGSAVLYVPDLPPYANFFNERYALNIIGIAIVTPLLLAAALHDRIQAMGAQPLRSIFCCWAYSGSSLCK